MYTTLWIEQFCISIANVFAQAIRLLSSSLGPETGYTGWRFSWTLSQHVFQYLYAYMSIIYTKRDLWENMIQKIIPATGLSKGRVILLKYVFLYE
jgi:hypothetical protein